MTALVICTALGVEARAVRRGLRGLTGLAGVAGVNGLAGLTEPPVVFRTGMGPERAARAAARLPPWTALAVTGFGGAVDATLRPGDVLVATEVRCGNRSWPCPSAAFLESELARAGLPAGTGPLVTSARIVGGVTRGRLARQGARAVDMESAPLAEAAGPRPFAALRVIVDAPGAPLPSLAALRGALSARITLGRIGPVLVRWAARETCPQNRKEAGP
ncbi:hypothetical protein JOL79_09425 [Microbispora sp. RL4-1S]|uniref:Nucleoside phosphorylase domain-containing protein n=1 Tax=Microbispora oryzae TaxID=2806554 RepID=A0A940WHC6_9ACTN|nr:hypothetical protein [Microbispora oryzae]MBP2704027.1 hypothetical protein [Microbispora oryzae]